MKCDIQTYTAAFYNNIDDFYFIAASFTLKIPLTDIGTSLSLNVPFSFTFPSTTRSFDGRSFQEDSETGRSFGSTTRADLYSTMEKYIATATGLNTKIKTESPINVRNKRPFFCNLSIFFVLKKQIFLPGIAPIAVFYI